jgi:hypothetical protein
MTGARGLSEERLAERLTQALEREANTIQVHDGWEAIANRLVSSSGPAPRLSRTSARRNRRRAIGAAGICVGVAAALVLAVVLGWRPSSTTPQPAATTPATSVPRYDPTIRTLVVYRSNVEVIAANQPKGSILSITPERMRTDSRDVGLAALNAMFETKPLHPGNVDWTEQKVAQKIDATSVTVSGGLIRVELNGFNSPIFSSPAAHVMAQAWVRTLQDTLGVRDDVLITLQGQPFLLYGQIDTAQPLKRDPKVPVVRTPGIDSPHDGDVVSSTFLLLGSAIASQNQPARIVVAALDTGAVVFDEQLAGTADRAETVDVTKTLTLDPGRYRATLSGIDRKPYTHEITFTVVR